MGALPSTIAKEGSTASGLRSAANLSSYVRTSATTRLLFPSFSRSVSSLIFVQGLRGVPS